MIFQQKLFDLQLISLARWPFRAKWHHHLRVVGYLGIVMNMHSNEGLLNYSVQCARQEYITVWRRKLLIQIVLFALSSSNISAVA